MVRCSVLGCNSDGEKKLPGISFHSFPEDATLRLKWIEATGRTNWNPQKTSKICSKHFEGHQLIKKTKLTVLYPNAVPLPLKVQNPDVGIVIESDVELPTSANVHRPAVVINPDVGAVIEPDVELPTSSNEHRHAVIINPDVGAVIEPDVELPTSANVHRPAVGMEPNYTPRTLKRKWTKAEEKASERLKKLKALREKTRRLTKKVANLEKMIAELKAKSLISEEDGDLLDSIDPINRDFLKKFLNPAGTSRKYSPELRKFALCLHFISPRAYKYVRQQFDTCLPHPSTLTSWYKSVDGTPGFTTESLECIKLLASHKKLYCALSIDEMVIRRHVQWNGTECVGLVNYGEALDGHNVTEANEALVFLINSINGSWKIPVGYFFITVWYMTSNSPNV